MEWESSWGSMSAPKCPECKKPMADAGSPIGYYCDDKACNEKVRIRNFPKMMLHIAYNEAQEGLMTLFNRAGAQKSECYCDAIGKMLEDIEIIYRALMEDLKEGK